MEALRERYNREARKSYASDFLPGLPYRSNREMWTSWAMFMPFLAIFPLMVLTGRVPDSGLAELIGILGLITASILWGLGKFAWIVWGRAAFPLRNEQHQKRDSSFFALVERYGREMEQSRTNGYGPAFHSKRGYPPPSPVYRSKREMRTWTLMQVIGFGTILFLHDDSSSFIELLALIPGFVVLYFLGWFAWVIWGRAAFPLRERDTPRRVREEAF